MGEESGIERLTGGRPFSPMLERAIELSAQWHDQTYRKSRWRREAFAVPEGEYLGVPVFAHVAVVALTVQRAGWDDVTVAAAFLHDVVEDRNRWRGRMDSVQLAGIVGHEVADLVDEVTEVKLDADGRPRSWRDRKEGYVARLSRASDRAIAISLADKLHNLWTINQSLEAGQNVFSTDANRRALQGGPEEQQWFFEEVFLVSESRNDPRLDAIRSRLKQEMDRFNRLCRSAGL